MSAIYRFEDIFSKDVIQGTLDINQNFLDIEKTIERISKKEVFKIADGKELQNILKDIKTIEDTQKKIITTEKKIETERKNIAKEQEKRLKTEQKARENFNKFLQRESEKRRKARQREAIQIQKNTITQKQAEQAIKSVIKTENDRIKVAGLLTKRLQQVDATTREGRKEINLLTQEIAKHNKILREAGKIRQDDRRNVGNYTSALGGLGNSLSGLAGSLGIAGGIALVGQKFSEFLTKTKELTSEQRKLANTFNLTSEESINLTSQINAISKAFDGADASELRVALNTVVKEFGNISEQDALDLIQEGFEKGSNNSGQFLDILKEYPAQFKAAGIDAQTSFAIINQQVREGIYSDKGADAIKEAGLRLRENTKAVQDALKPLDESIKAQIQQEIAAGNTFKAIQLVSEALSDTSLTANETQTIIADVFGGAGEDAGLRYLQTLKDINSDLSGVEKQTTSGQDAILKFNTAINKLLLQIADGTGFLNKFVANIIEFGTAIVDSVSKGNALTRTFERIFNMIKPLVNEVSNLLDFFGFLKTEVSAVDVIFGILSTTLNIATAPLQLLVFLGRSFIAVIKSMIIPISEFVTSFEIVNSTLTFVKNSAIAMKDAIVELLQTMGVLDVEAQIAINTGGKLSKIKRKIKEETDKEKESIFQLSKAIREENKETEESIKLAREQAKAEFDAANKTKSIAGERLEAFRDFQELQKLTREQSVLNERLEIAQIQDSKKRKQAQTDFDKKILIQDAEFKKQQAQDFLTFLSEQTSTLTESQRIALENTIKELDLQLLEAKTELKPDESVGFLADILGLTPVQETLLKEKFDEFKSQLKEFVNQSIEIRRNGINEEINLIDQLIEKDQDRINEIDKNNQAALEKGAAFDLSEKERLEKKIVEENARRQQLVNEEKRLANIQKGIALTKAVINTAGAVTQALNNPFPLNFIIAGLVGAAGALEIATIAQQKFETGTEYLELNGNKPGRDTVPGIVKGQGIVMLDAGERIIPKTLNAKIPRHLTNDELVNNYLNYDKFLNLDSFLPQNNFVVNNKNETLESQGKETNLILRQIRDKKEKYYNEKGKLIKEISGVNSTIYV